MKVGNLIRDRRTVTVQVGDGAVTVTYKPSGITPETEDVLREMVAEQRVGPLLVELLSRVLVDWDLQDDDGKPYPIKPEALRCLPTLFLGAVVQAISEEMRPNPSSGGGSAAG